MLKYIFFAFAALCGSVLYALDDHPVEGDYSPFDEELTKLLVEDWNSLMGDDADVSDEEFKSRMSQISGAIDYRLTKEVKERILMRTEKYRSSTERILGRSEMYFPIFEEHLAKYNVSHHLKYLPIVESHLNPVAKSRAKAVGLWQFIRPTGLLYGLKINSSVDERSDTHKASEAAAKMLSELYKRYGDWALALAAYNCGLGRVDKIIAKREKNYWKVRKYLPKETQMYVPYFMAVAYVGEYAEKHNLKPKKMHRDLVLTDSIHLEPGYKKLSQLARQYDISYDTLKALNPGYRKGYIPSNVKQPILVLPARIVAAVRGSEAGYKRLMSLPVSDNPIKCIRRVNSPADVAFYAKAHRCTVKDLKRWNQLPMNYTFKKGDVILIRQFKAVMDAAELIVKQTLKDISIPSLKVIGLNNMAHAAMTAPVYLNNDKVEMVVKRKLAEDNLLSRSRSRRLRPSVRQQYVVAKGRKSSAANSAGLPRERPKVIAAVPSVKASGSIVQSEQNMRVNAKNIYEESKARHTIAQREKRGRDIIEAERFLAGKLNRQFLLGKKKEAVKVEQPSVRAPEEVPAVRTTVRGRARNLRAQGLDGKVSLAESKKEFSSAADVKAEAAFSLSKVLELSHVKMHDGYVYYQLQEQETLWDVQKHFPYMTIHEIASMNNLTLSDDLDTGFKLKLRNVE